MTLAKPPASVAAPKKPWYKILYIQVLMAIVLGAVLGWLFPEFGKNDWVKALGDGFVKLIRMVIAPIIFCTVVSGIAHISEVKKVGRVAIKALVYFEIVSTFALCIGLMVANVLHPGQRAFRQRPMPPRWPASPSRRAEMKSVDFVLHIIPDSAVGAFAAGDILQVLLFADPVRFRADGARRTRSYAARRSSTISPTPFSASSPSS